MLISRIKHVFIGNPLTLDKLEEERIPKWKALAVLSSDALSSVAYATEEVLIPLSLFAITAMAWSIPMAIGVAALLLIITLSYQQTISAYPHGGGAYTVAKENLGENAGLVAGAALLIDYILTVSVSVSAGLENIGSAFPFIAEHRVVIGVLIIFTIMMLNLRGLRESSNIFAYPTYFFIFSILLMVCVGAYKIFMGYAPVIHPVIHESYPEVPLFLLMRAFASGCSALTGIEAISNGVPIFRKPSQHNAKVTMLWMAFILGSFFLGITLLAHVYGIVPSHGGETVMSQLARQIFGHNVFYYATQVAVALILLLAANTSYADFPRLTSLIAKDRFLPRQMSSVGDRLVFSNGIIGLTCAAAFLLIAFKGSTHLLIPLYAVGVFLSFTLSQTGMIIHHIKYKEAHWKKALSINALGALTTLSVLIVIGITKFMSGAWMVIILIPSLVIFFKQIKSHYVAVGHQLARDSYHQDIDLKTTEHFTAIVPISGIHPGVVKAVRYALTVSDDVRVCYVDVDKEATAKMLKVWDKWSQGLPLEVLESPYRSVLSPLLAYIDKVHVESGKEMISVIVPEFITKSWYHQFLHNQMTFVLRATLRFKPGKVVTAIKYYL
ncbi:APC family permease [Bacteriovorax sp. PP10]|uniref:APC family permease n=1 Tax=Bacteriovorax antarcticus TaxID=3088717 RepID=A0ABU5VYY7_9BACT|nr:APC family permease [Bacteriovorax sp. PP10]MEA9358286.1 APC family permease [Bacteriovorax sp. PP10]